jgi:hypothetical protein
MKKERASIFHALATAALPTILIFVVNAAIALAQRPSGNIFISTDYRVKGQNFALITIDNYTKKPIDGIILDTNLDLNGDVSVTGPVDLILKSNARAPQGSEVWQMNVMAVNSEAAILIPIDSSNKNPYIKVTNAASLGLDQRPLISINNEVNSALKGVAIDAAVYFVVFAAFSWWLQWINREKTDRLIERSKNIRSRFKEFRKRTDKELEEAKAALKNIRGLIAKDRLLTSARLKDLSTELSFWRQAVKQVLVQKGVSNASADEILAVVTRSLGTFMTLSKKGLDIQELVVISKILASSDDEM